MRELVLFLGQIILYKYPIESTVWATSLKGVLKEYGFLAVRQLIER
jgi:hypothetical protein